MRSLRSRHQANAVLSKLAGPLLDLLFPLNCAGCDRGGGVLCGRCREALPGLKAPFCHLCAAPGGREPCRLCAAEPLAIDGIRAPYLMEGTVRDLVHALKYRDLRAAAAEVGRLLAGYMEANPLRVEVLVPVPLHRRRLRERGYNQSELMARELGMRTGIPLDTAAVRRERDTPPQVSTDSRQERRKNMEGAFECSRALEGRQVLLLDDVVTTGATMSACAGAIRASGAKSVWGLALARNQAKPQAGGQASESP